MSTMFKRQQFKDNKKNRIKPKGSKCQQFNKNNNEKGHGLEKNKSEVENDNILFFSLLFFFFLPKKSQTACQIQTREPRV